MIEQRGGKTGKARTVKSEERAEELKAWNAHRMLVRQRRLALAKTIHERLAENSPLNELDPHTIEAIGQQVTDSAVWRIKSAKKAEEEERAGRGGNYEPEPEPEPEPSRGWRCCLSRKAALKKRKSHKKTRRKRKSKNIKEKRRNNKKKRTNKRRKKSKK